MNMHSCVMKPQVIVYPYGKFGFEIVFLLYGIVSYPDSANDNLYLRIILYIF